MNTLMVPAFSGLQTRLHGEVIGPGDGRYDRARRVWNGRIDRYPSCIVYCVDAGDVLTAIDFARQAELPVTVRSGGHSMIGLSVCDDGLVIDLSRMKEIEVDPVRRVVRVQAGLTLGEFVHKTQEYGLATTTGTVSGTGIGGLTLGGGIGWLMGKYGLTVDSLLSVDLVTADGQVLTASADVYPDLFWGARRRWRQLRGRYLLYVPTAPGRHGPGGEDQLSAVTGEGGAALLPGVYAGCA